MRPHPGIVIQGQTIKHNAIDIVCMEGDKIVASHNGKMKYHYNRFMGNVVVIENESLRSSYSHLQSINKLDEVEKGDIIGFCGSTGKWSNGPHLHFELYETTN